MKKVNRRSFISAAGLGLGSLACSDLIDPRAQAKPGNHLSGKIITEPQKEIPVVRSADVVVCGAGPAGVAAAIAAARKGAKTIILDSQGCLGGIWTASLLSLILDTKEKKGIMAEILKRLVENGGLDSEGKRSNLYDPERMKLLLEEMCLETGVEIQYFTQIVDTVVENKQIKAVITESKSGREAITGKVFIDCTGDGDVAAQSGCGFDFGNPDTKAFQPMSFIVLLAGIQHEEVRQFYSKPRLLEEMNKAGFQPSYRGPSLFRIRNDFFAMMSNHEYGYRGFDVRELTRATLQGRKEMFQQINALRKYGGPWKNVQIVSTPSLIGIREGRRIHGLYTVGIEDLRVGKKHEDAVCSVAFPIDVHSTTKMKGKEVERAPFRVQPYDIPMRALIAKDVEGLMMAGRCISGDFIAHSSYRVTGNAVPMGEAAGELAAKAAKDGKNPSSYYVS
ncbi:MAG: FAD-dependent oxidoreductase [Planctomycetia bacterium]|nr:FAD-dependent oxidoreductase [Planctomycetia bacterium]